MTLALVDVHDSSLRCLRPLEILIHDVDGFCDGLFGHPPLAAGAGALHVAALHLLAVAELSDALRLCCSGSQVTTAPGQRVFCRCRTNRPTKERWSWPALVLCINVAAE